MEALTAKDKNLIALTQKVDGLTKRFDTLFVQADELTKKQLALESLHEQLGQVDDLAKKTSARSIRSSRAGRISNRCARRFSISTSRTPKSPSCATSWAPTASRSRPSTNG